MIKLAFGDFKQVQLKLGSVARGTVCRQINVFIWKIKLIKAMPNKHLAAFLHVQKTKAQISCVSSEKLIKH